MQLFFHHTSCSWHQGEWLWGGIFCSFSPNSLTSNHCHTGSVLWQTTKHLIKCKGFIFFTNTVSCHHFFSWNCPILFKKNGSRHANCGLLLSPLPLPMCQTQVQHKATNPLKTFIPNHWSLSWGNPMDRCPPSCRTEPKVPFLLPKHPASAGPVSPTCPNPLTCMKLPNWVCSRFLVSALLSLPSGSAELLYTKATVAKAFSRSEPFPRASWGERKKLSAYWKKWHLRYNWKESVRTVLSGWRSM